MKQSTELYLQGAGKFGLAVGRVGAMFAIQAITRRPASSVSRAYASKSFGDLIHDGKGLVSEANELRKKGQ